MKKIYSYYVYILTNFNETTFYIGVTNSLCRRIDEHKTHINEGFSKRYSLDKLVYYEYYDSVDAAIYREKQLKNWKRSWKLDLIRKMNPEFRDLSEDFENMDCTNF